MPERKWARDEIISEIKRLHSSGQNISCNYCLFNRRELYESARRRFGTWENAVNAAGIDYDTIRKKHKKFSRETILSELKELHCKGKNIRPRALTKEHPGLMAAGIRMFGDSRGMYKAAGIDPIDIGATRQWSREIIIQNIKKRHQAGRHMDLTAAKGEYKELVVAAREYYGGWYPALRAAGIEPDKYRLRKPKHYWSKQTVLSAVRTRYESGEAMDGPAVRKDDGALSAAAHLLFGSWYGALDAAGIASGDYRMLRPPEHRVEEIKPHGYWTKETVIAEIRQRHEAGEGISGDVVKREAGQLASAACRYFGNWYAAVEAAGIKSEGIRKIKAVDYWTDEVILDAIKQRLKDGKDLRTRAVSREDSGLLVAGNRRFGNWYSAVEAAGISPGWKEKPPIGYWTKERIIDEIKAVHSKGEDLSDRNISITHSKLYGAAYHHLDSWQNAVEAAGIDYDSFRRMRKDYTKDELLEMLRKWHSEDIPLARTAIEMIRPGLTVIIEKYFGSYKNAIEALGLDYDKIRRDIDTESFKGNVFELYVREALTKLGWDIDYRKKFRFGREVCIPDFVNRRTGTWIDAKLNSHGMGVAITLRQYLPHTDEILIIYLQGKNPSWDKTGVEFMPISYFYSELRAIGEEELVENIELLRKGITKPEQQRRILDYVSRIAQDREIRHAFKRAR